MSIDHWRNRIDELDRKLVELFNERAQCAIEVGKIKGLQRINVFDPERERQIIVNVLRENRGPLDDDALRRIFESVIGECKRIEQP